MIEIRVLGPLEMVTPAGAEVVIGSAKQRELLALLVAHAPHVVSVDRIVDALWGDDRDHLSSLRFHVSRLRDAVDPDRTGDVIVTQPPGYRLGTGAGSVDAHRFVALIDESERLKQGDRVAAVQLLDEALGLWRGEPYAEFEYAAWAREEVTRLEELRLVAIERRIEADLALGRHDALVGELEALLVQHPLREHLWRHLMLALYRSGRQPEALRAYRRASEAFAELGTTPSAALEHLETQVLLRDPSLQDTASPGVTIGNIPSPLSTFVGRRDEVVMVRDQVAAHRLVTLLGPGGVGKTRLAIEAARGLTTRFQDGVWLVELAGADAAGLVVSEVARVLSVVERSGEDLPATLARYLRGRSTLLVLDNCEHLKEAVAALTAQILASSPALHVLATSRQPLGLKGEVAWRTGPLPIEPSNAAEICDEPRTSATDAVQLFFDRAQEAQPSFEVTPEAEALAPEVCRRLAGLPLAIELAAARLNMMSLTRLVERLDNEFELLTDGSAEAVGHHRAMRATLDWSYRLLDPLEQAMFRRLAVFRGGFTLELVERFHELYPAAEGNALRLLGRLVDTSMVERSTDDRFKMLEPIRHYGLLVLEECGEEATAFLAHSLVYCEALRLPDSDLFGVPTNGPMRHQFIMQMDNVRAALNRAFEHGDAAIAVELGVAAGCHFCRVGHLAEANHWLSRALSVSSEATPNRARALTRAAFISAFLDGPDRAESLVEELEATAQAVGDDRWRAAGIERRALLALLRDDVETASTLWAEAAELLFELDDPEARVPLSNHMEALYYAGDYLKADLAATQLAELGARFDDPELVASAAIGRSFIAAWRGDPDSAERHFATAAEHFAGDAGFDSYGSMFIPGFIALLRRDFDEAERVGSAHLSSARESRHPDSFYRGLVLIGLAHFHRGDELTGHRFLIEALRDASQVGVKHFQRFVLGATAATLAMIDPVRGAVLLGAVQAAKRRDHRSMPAPINVAVEQASAALEDSLSAEELAQARRRGREMGLDEAVAFALQAG